MKSNNKFLEKWALPSTWLSCLITILLILGVFFRFANLDRKVYWGDESYSSLRIAGYKWSEIAQLFEGQEIGSSDFQKYQYVNPAKGFPDMIDSLAVEDPHHPPLYYALGRFWVQWFGDSVTVRRSLSALLSLLVFPCAYWLCLELFQSSLTGWIAVALIAISPFHLLYAQEVREYSLWIATILLSSATLLRAMRLNTKLNWGIYAVTVALGLYTFLFSALVIVTHSIYVFVIERFRFSKRLIAYGLATVVGIIIFSPWLFIVLTNLARIQVTNSDKEGRVPFSYLIQMWMADLSHVFYDINFGYQDPFDIKIGLNQPLSYLIIPTFILLIYSIYFLIRTAEKKAWLFVTALIGVTALALILPDLILGGSRSINARYLTASYLGLQLALAYLFANKISFPLVNNWQPKFWSFAMGILISGGVLSCAIVSQADTSWMKYSDYYTPPIVRIINQAERPLLVTDSPYRMFSFSYRLDPKVRIQVFQNHQKISKINQGFSDVFLLNTYRNRSRKFREEFEKKQNVKLKSVYSGDLIFKDREVSLWKVVD